MTGQKPMTATLPRYQWSANEYLRMIEAGLFNKIELLQGDLVVVGAACKPYHWTLEAYDRIVSLGLLEGKHVELVQGEILVTSPTGEPHALTIIQLNEILIPYFNSRTGYRLRIQMPLASPDLGPEPDLAVVTLDAPTSAAGLPAPCSSSRLRNRPSPMTATTRARSTPRPASATSGSSISPNAASTCTGIRSPTLNPSPLGATGIAKLYTPTSRFPLWRRLTLSSRPRRCFPHRETSDYLYAGPAVSVPIPLTPKRRYSDATRTRFTCQSPLRKGAHHGYGQ